MSLIDELRRERATMRPDYEIVTESLSRINQPARGRLIAAGIDDDWATTKNGYPSDRFVRAVDDAIQRGLIVAHGVGKGRRYVCS